MLIVNVHVLIYLKNPYGLRTVGNLVDWYFRSGSGRRRPTVTF